MSETAGVFLSILSALGIACSIIFGYIAYKRKEKCENETEGKKDGVLLTEIGYIKSGVDDIKRKQEKQDEQYVIVMTRLATVESSVKQAHHRLDEISKEH
ncbi:MAG: hypothetical protein Q4E28_05040 [Clostridia bacterium]|nr:hypothetical protein [Clostridia bacterium]